MCDFPFCKSERIFKGGFCYDHWRLMGTSEVKKEPKPISDKSSKRKELEKEYLKIKKEMLKESDRCEAKLTGCTGKAVDLHHMAGRIGKLYVEKDNLMRVCRSCHHYITENPLQAIELGLSKYRNKTDLK